LRTRASRALGKRRSYPELPGGPSAPRVPEIPQPPRAVCSAFFPTPHPIQPTCGELFSRSIPR
jgi:hypothetical protein